MNVVNDISLRVSWHRCVGGLCAGLKAPCADESLMGCCGAWSRFIEMLTDERGCRIVWSIILFSRISNRNQRSSHTHAHQSPPKHKSFDKSTLGVKLREFAERQRSAWCLQIKHSPGQWSPGLLVRDAAAKKSFHHLRRQHPALCELGDFELVILV